MKFKFVVFIVEKLLKTKANGDEPRADMFLPDWVLAFGIVLACVGLGFLIAFIVLFNYILLLVALGAFLLTAIAVLCWRNQTIRIIDDTKFEYSTFLGKKKVYYFDEIKQLRRNSDSMTLFVGDGKVHIEACAVMTERLVNLINEALARN